MHDTALMNGKRFFDTYVRGLVNPIVVDIGAQNVNGSLKSIFKTSNTPGLKYVGVDFVEGEGVDVILTDPYNLPFEDESVDVIVCSSCFEHSEFFWLLFLEVIRILKRGGLFYLNVPSNGAFHRYPVDCWRFYPDSGVALARWAQRNGSDVAVLESYIGERKQDIWNDFICVFLKDASFSSKYTQRMLTSTSDYTNGLKDPEVVENTKKNFLNFSEKTQDQRLLNRCFFIFLRRSIRWASKRLFQP